MRVIGLVLVIGGRSLVEPEIPVGDELLPMGNLARRYGYTRFSTKKIYVYVVDDDLAQELSQAWIFRIALVDT